MGKLEPKFDFSLMLKGNLALKGLKRFYRVSQKKGLFKKNIDFPENMKRFILVRRKLCSLINVAKKSG